MPLNLNTNRQKKMELTSQEKVLFNAHKKFHMEHGANETEAIKAATEKIEQTRKLSKSLRFRY
jgi:cell division protein FtsB